MEPKRPNESHSSFFKSEKYDANFDGVVICSEAFWMKLKDTTHVTPIEKANPQLKPRRQKPLSYHRRVLQSAGSISASRFEEIQGGDESDIDDEDFKAVIESLQIHDFEAKSLKKPEEKLLSLSEEDEHGWSPDIQIIPAIPPELRNHQNLRYIFRHISLTGIKIQIIDEEMEYFPNLHTLDLSENNIEVLQNLPYSLQNFMAYNNIGLSRISERLFLPNLLQLALAYNEIEDMGPLGECCPGLLRLDLAHNDVRDLRRTTAALGRLPRLLDLNLTGTPVSLLRIYRPNILFYFPNLTSLDDLAITPGERCYSTEIQEKLDPLGDETADGDNTKKKKGALSGKQRVLAARYVQRWLRSRAMAQVAKSLITMLSDVRTSIQSVFYIEVRSVLFPTAIAKLDKKSRSRQASSKAPPSQRPSSVAFAKSVHLNRALSAMQNEEEQGQLEDDDDLPRIYVKIEVPEQLHEEIAPVRAPAGEPSGGGGGGGALRSRGVAVGPHVDLGLRRKFQVAVGRGLRDALRDGGPVRAGLYLEAEGIPPGTEHQTNEHKDSLQEIKTMRLAEGLLDLRPLLDPLAAREGLGSPSASATIKFNLNEETLLMMLKPSQISEDFTRAHFTISASLNVHSWSSEEKILYKAALRGAGNKI